VSRSVLYDEPGPRTRRLERNASIVVGALLLVGAVLIAVGMANRGLFDDRWLVFTDPPKSQTAADVWGALWRGLRATLVAAVVAAPAALVLAFLLTVLRTSGSPVVARGVVVLIEFLRGMPVLLMMFFGLLAFGLSAFGAVAFGLIVYNAAVMSEILRAGLAAVPKGQVEAGTAIGLTRWQTLRIIQVPQVVRLMLPSLISQFVVLLKDSSLGFIVGYPELLRTMQLSYSFFGDRYRFPLFVVVLAIYLTVNITLSRVAIVVERRLSARGQGGAVPVPVAPEATVAPGPTPYAR
jgi:glutamate transport system permease protein